MSRDCTDPPLVANNEQSACHGVPNTMAKRNSKNINNKQSQRAKKVVANRNALQPAKRRNYTPFADVGSTIGSAVSSLTGLSIAKPIGKWLGSGIGSIFGSGDYTMLGLEPKYNVLNGSIPKFETSSATNVICHREYLADIYGATAFVNAGYALNPGLGQTFPWLATIAQNYQQYRFHGLVFEFRPLTTDYANSGVPGVVIMSTNYNAAAPIYTSKPQMENAEFAMSVKPTMPLMHMVECDPAHTADIIKYVRTGAIPSGQDARLYDLGVFQFATQGNSSSVDLGELWVTYCIEFFKPVISTIGGSSLGASVYRSGVINAKPMGTTTVSAQGNVSISIGDLAISWASLPGACWMLQFTWSGTAAAFTVPGATINGGAGVLYYFDANSVAQGPAPGVSSASCILTYALQCSASSTSLGITFDTAGSLPTGATKLDISLQPLSPGSF